MEYVYIIECKDGSLYTGWTTNIDERIKAHNEGKGAKYTRGRGPVKLVHLEKFDNRSDALKRELAVKKLTRSQKERLISKGSIISKE